MWAGQLCLYLLHLQQQIVVRKGAAECWLSHTISEGDHLQHKRAILAFELRSYQRMPHVHV